jgi:hypothetical protein
MRIRNRYFQYFIRYLKKTGFLMLELVLSDEAISPIVHLLTGPRVRLTMSTSEDLSQAIASCAGELALAVETALHQLYEEEHAPARIFIRDEMETQIITTTDPCKSYSLDSIVRF